MRILVLGGTVFLGRAVAGYALAAGDDVTCAARGVSGEPLPGVGFVRVDRDAPGGLAALDGQRFDAVVDTASRPSRVRSAVGTLADRTGHLTYVSTISVYADLSVPGQGPATTRLHPPAPAGTDDPAGNDYADYGPCKVACEQAALGGHERVLVCRPGLIVGPGDPLHRFGYWVDRIARGGEVLAPGDPEDPVQLIDARDLAAWIVESARSGRTGVYDTIGAPMPRREFLAGVADGVAGPADAADGSPDTALTWVSSDFLREHGVTPWDGPRSLPFWLPGAEYRGLLARDADPVLAAGLRTRPVADSARDTRDWLASGQEQRPPAGLSPAEEAELLAAWHTTVETGHRSG